MEKNPQLILVADDSPVNLRILRIALGKEGYRLLEVQDGIQVLELVEGETPDLFLLDVMMPRMDGFETCRRLKEDSRFKVIPVIFLTARTQVGDKLAGLKLGATDYVSKPFDIGELVARVRTPLRMKSLYEENIAYQKALLESQWATSIKTITGGIAHNFNNLLTGVSGYLELAINGFGEDHSQFKNLCKAKSAALRLQEITTLLHKYVRAGFEGDRPEPISLRDVLHQAVSLFTASEKSAAEVISLDLPDSPFVIQGHSPNLVQTLVNLLQNAYEATEERGRIQVRVTGGVTIEEATGFEGNYTLVEIRDNGKGITEELLPIVKEPFVTTKQTVGVGLGLTVAEGIVKEHGGFLRITSRVNQGTKVSVYLPEKSP